MDANSYKILICGMIQVILAGCTEDVPMGYTLYRENIRKIQGKAVQKQMDAYARDSQAEVLSLYRRQQLLKLYGLDNPEIFDLTQYKANSVKENQ